jgi:hypothetical protein
MTIPAATLTRRHSHQPPRFKPAPLQCGHVAIRPGTFVFFAAFDGTNNNRNIRNGDGRLQSGDPLDTSVSQVQLQVEQVAPGAAFYYEGPGTGGNLDPSAVFPTGKILEIANNAYRDFAQRARDWLRGQPRRRSHRRLRVVQPWRRRCGRVLSIAVRTRFD